VEITTGVVETALRAMGTPYQWGGTDANGFDCSGLIQFAYAQHGIQMPRVSREQLRSGRAVEPEMGILLPGDVLGFSGEAGGKASHVGLYLGQGDFIHSSPRGVVLSNLDNPYWRQHFIAARRIVR
jgi:cell wall-associated NlpC family hydrolase